MASGDAATKRAAFTDEVILPDELVETARAHPGGQRLALRRWLEERFGAGADGTSRWHGARDGSADAAGQAKLDPVRTVTSHRPKRVRMSAPPMITMRRMSRAT